jgi:hypothetical protein
MKGKTPRAYRYARVNPWDKFTTQGEEAYAGKTVHSSSGGGTVTAELQARYRAT